MGKRNIRSERCKKAFSHSVHLLFAGQVLCLQISIRNAREIEKNIEIVSFVELRRQTELHYNRDQFCIIMRLIMTRNTKVLQYVIYFIAICISYLYILSYFIISFCNVIIFYEEFVF